MGPFTVRMLQPIPVYLDEKEGGNTLAARPATLEGKVVGLLPNWRPAAGPILKALGALLKERCRVKELVMEPPMREAPMGQGRLLDGLRERLDDFAKRVDVAIIATGD